MSFDEQYAKNRAALQRLLKKVGVKAKRENGQNFLVDGTVAEDLVNAANVTSQDHILEIGPGLGAVTELLLERGARVTGIELDERLAQHLTKRFSADSRVRIIHADVLKVHLEDIVTDQAYKLVSSLPFNITSLVLRNFLERFPRPTEISLLIQKEVAERVAAPPGQSSLLSLSCQYLGQPEIRRIVPSGCFFPEPKVDGAIIHIRVRPLPPELERTLFFRIARIGFSARRKTLANNLQAGMRISREKTHKMLEKCGIPLMARPQELSVEDWLKLSNLFV